MNHHDHNPYQTPDSDLTDDYHHDDECPPLYNPKAVAVWSFILTPLLGAWLHAKNWKALGEDDLARQNLIALWLMIAWFIITTLMDMMAGIEIPMTMYGLVPSVAWYFALGKQQITAFKEYLDDDYPRKSLWVAIPLGVIVIYIIILIITFVLTAILSSFGLLHANYQ